MAMKHFDNYDFVQNHEQYIKELELLNEALEKVKGKIKTWSGKLLFDEHKHTVEVLLDLNTRKEVCKYAESIYDMR